MKTGFVKNPIGLVIWILLCFPPSNGFSEDVTQKVSLVDAGQPVSTELALVGSVFQKKIRLDSDVTGAMSLDSPWECDVRQNSPLKIRDAETNKDLVAGKISPFPRSRELWLEIPKEQASLSSLRVDFDCSRRKRPETSIKIHIDAALKLAAEDVFGLDPPKLDFKTGEAQKSRVRISNKLREAIDVAIRGAESLRIEPARTVKVAATGTTDVSVSSEASDSDGEGPLTFSVPGHDQPLEAKLAIQWRSRPWPWGTIFKYVVAVVLGVGLVTLISRRVVPTKSGLRIDFPKKQGSTLFLEFQRSGETDHQKTSGRICVSREYDEPRVTSSEIELTATVNRSREHESDIYYDVHLVPRIPSGHATLTVRAQPKAWLVWRRPLKATFPVEWSPALATPKERSWNQSLESSITPNADSRSGGGYSTTHPSSKPSPVSPNVNPGRRVELGSGGDARWDELAGKIDRLGTNLGEFDALRTAVQRGNSALAEHGPQIQALNGTVLELKADFEALFKTIADNNNALAASTRAMEEQSRSTLKATQFIGERLDASVKKIGEQIDKIWDQLDWLTKQSQLKNNQQKDSWVLGLLENVANNNISDVVVDRLSKPPSVSSSVFINLVNKVQYIQKILDRLTAQLVSPSSLISDVQATLKKIEIMVVQVSNALEGKPMELPLSIKFSENAGKLLAVQIARQLESTLSLMADPIGKIKGDLDNLIITEIPKIAKMCDNQKNAKDLAPVLESLFQSCELTDTTPKEGGLYRSDDHVKLDSAKGDLNRVIRIVDRGFKYNDQVIQQPKVVVGTGA
jgi:hypothetical protein